MAKGKHMSAENKEKLRLSHLGKHMSAEHKEKLRLSHLGKPAWNRGISPSDATRKKQSLAKIGSKNYWYGRMSGSDNINWHDGKSFEEYGREFDRVLHEFVGERDHHTCQICGRKEGTRKHCIHHIDYDKKNNDTMNLIELCNSCHSITNFNRSEWINWFQEVQKKRKLHNWCSALELS
jgi:hypothetical protein